MATERTKLAPWRIVLAILLRATILVALMAVAGVLDKDSPTDIQQSPPHRAATIQDGLVFYPSGPKSEITIEDNVARITPAEADTVSEPVIVKFAELYHSTREVLEHQISRRPESDQWVRHDIGETSSSGFEKIGAARALVMIPVRSLSRSSKWVERKFVCEVEIAQDGISSHHDWRFELQ